MIPVNKFTSPDAGQYATDLASLSPIQRDSRKPIKRISRACLRCRQRKSKCNLGNLGQTGTPPCESCLKDGAECVLATSKRGGKRIRRSTLPLIASNVPPQFVAESAPRSSSAQTPMQSPFRPEVTISTPNIDETIASTELHAMSEALNILSHAAQLDSYATSGHHPAEPPNANVSLPNHENEISRVEVSGQGGILQYDLVSRGLLTPAQVMELLVRILSSIPTDSPRRSFDPESLQYLATREPHLLTAMITVAARDLPHAEGILHSCSGYMHQLVSEIIAGKKCDVEAVEALLLLAEWEPQDSLSEGKEVGCGEEDRAAWMHVGLALRIGYFLGLDRTALKHDDEEKAAHVNRRRVTWAACYISDRQLSARVGRAFWSRGPVAVTAVGRHGRQTFDEFRPLQPESPEETDYASILQANLDLTQLFSNVHDVLYSGMGSSMKMMLAGNYVKYIDDFRRAIESWKSAWGTLTCPPNIKATLQLSYEYLRLYTSAYAFQATVTRSLAALSRGLFPSSESPHNGVPSLPDARFIYESVDAAKTLLSIVTSYIDAENCLRFLPLRFSLYCVNSAVFLYKAWSFDVLSTQEKHGIRCMIKDVIRRLQKASVRPNDFLARYSELLDRLWQRKDTSPNHNPSAQAQTTSSPSTIHRVINDPTTTTTSPSSQAQPQAQAPNTSTNTTANLLPHPSDTNPYPPSRPLPAATQPNISSYAPHQDEFSWLDLQAVGELVSGDPNFNGMDSYGQGNFTTLGNGMGDWGGQGGMMDGDDFGRFF